MLSSIQQKRQRLHDQTEPRLARFENLRLKGPSRLFFWDRLQVASRGTLQLEGLQTRLVPRMTFQNGEDLTLTPAGLRRLRHDQTNLTCRLINTHTLF